jgi:hypothetical protein
MSIIVLASQVVSISLCGPACLCPLQQLAMTSALQCAACTRLLQAGIMGHHSYVAVGYSTNSRVFVSQLLLLGARTAHAALFIQPTLSCCCCYAVAMTCVEFTALAACGMM